MNTRILGAAALIALAAGSTQVVHAHAQSQKTAAGSITYLSDTVTSLGSVGSDRFYSEVEPGASHGSISGIIMDTDTYLEHHNGSYVGQGVETCASCTIDGKTGTYTAMYSFSGNANTFTGTLLFTQASGGLAGLQGGGTFSGNETQGHYTYTYSFKRKG